MMYMKTSFIIFFFINGLNFKGYENSSLEYIFFSIRDSHFLKFLLKYECFK